MRIGWLLVLAACGDSASPAEARLIAMLEGTHAERPVDGTDQADWPPWAHVVDGTLKLDPDCGTVLGTSGPPEVFVLDNADRGDAITVQVAPTLEGECLPRLLTCIDDTLLAANDVDSCTPWHDATTTNPDDRRLSTDFCVPDPDTAADECPDLGTISDKVIHFKVDRRSDDDDPVLSRITTDAPLVFDGGNPKRIENEAQAHLYNDGTIGQFKITYEIVREPSPGMAQELLAQDGFDLAWRDAPFGIEVVDCTANDVCKIHHDDTRAANGDLCLATKAVNGDQISINLQLWIDPNPNAPRTFDSLLIEGATDELPPIPVAFRSGLGGDGGSGDLTLHLDSADIGPFDVRTDIGNPQGKRLVFHLWGCTAPAGARCARPTTRPDAKFAITVGESCP